LRSEYICFSTHFAEKYHDIIKIKATRRNYYMAFHNIMWLNHPPLNKKKLETNIPAQGMGIHFGNHVHGMVSRNIWCMKRPMNAASLGHATPRTRFDDDIPYYDTMVEARWITVHLKLPRSSTATNQ
jgi:hypothetical protein